MKPISTLIFSLLVVFANAQIIDPTFGIGGQVKLDNFISGSGIEVLSNGKILIVGSSDSATVVNGNYFNNTRTVTVVALKPNGTLDTNFGINGYAAIDIDTLLFPSTFVEFTSTGNDLFIQPDGKILVVGTIVFSSLGTGIKYGFILRLTANGTLDTSFGLLGVARLYSNSYYGLREAYSVSMLSSGKIVCGGIPLMGLGVMRLESNGVRDSTFGNYGVADSSGMHIEPNKIAFLFEGTGNNIIAIGGKNTLGDDFSFSRYKIKGNGTLDTTYANGVVDVGNNSVQVLSATMNSDSSVFAGGVTFSNSSTNGVVYKIKTNGDVDSTYGANGFYKSVNRAYYTHIKIEPDNKLILSGTQRTDSLRYCIQRITASGQNDVSFGTNGYFQSPSQALFQISSGAYPSSTSQPDGKIVFASRINPLNQPSKNTQLERFGLSAINAVEEIPELHANLYPNPVAPSATIYLDMPAEKISIKIIDIAGKTISQISNSNNLIAPDMPGLYIIQVKTHAGIANKKLLVN